jgi:Fe2+ transport system protein B
VKKAYVLFIYLVVLSLKDSGVFANKLCSKGIALAGRYMSTYGLKQQSNCPVICACGVCAVYSCVSGRIHVCGQRAGNVNEPPAED